MWKTGHEARLVSEGLQPRPGETGQQGEGKGTDWGGGAVLCCYVPLAERDSNSLLFGLIMG